MRWPWQGPIVEHRSSLTDQVITAILTAATGGGARPALATAALESCATLYASALSACTVSGPTKAFFQIALVLLGLVVVLLHTPMQEDRCKPIRWISENEPCSTVMPG